MPEPNPPLGRRANNPDTIAPDGSEIRFLVDQRHGAKGASVVQVTLGAGQVSRPVRHRTVEEGVVRSGRRRTGLALSPGCGTGPDNGCAGGSG